MLSKHIKSSQALYLQSCPKDTLSYHPPSKTAPRGNFQVSDKKRSPFEPGIRITSTRRTWESWLKHQLTQCCKGESVGVRDDLENSGEAGKEITQEPSLKGGLGWVGRKGESLGSMGGPVKGR